MVPGRGCKTLKPEFRSFVFTGFFVDNLERSLKLERLMCMKLFNTVNMADTHVGE